MKHVILLQLWELHTKFPFLIFGWAPLYTLESWIKTLVSASDTWKPEKKKYEWVDLKMFGTLAQKN